MVEKKDNEVVEQIQAQYEFELRTLVGAVVGLGPKFGVKLKDIQNHIETILKETTE